MFDVGGQRSERKKWIHCFENVHCLLFLAAISGYDQCLVDDKHGLRSEGAKCFKVLINGSVSQNQMNEALMLWDSIANSHWFNKSAMILFLNKMAKLPKNPITKYVFTDYRGPEDDYKAAGKYFLDKFRALCRNPEKEVYSHFTSATNTNFLKITVESIQGLILQRNWKQVGFIT